MNFAAAVKVARFRTPEDHLPKAVSGHKMCRFGRAPPDLVPPPQGATGEFLAQNLDLARAPPRLQDG